MSARVASLWGGVCATVATALLSALLAAAPLERAAAQSISAGGDGNTPRGRWALLTVTIFNPVGNDTRPTDLMIEFRDRGSTGTGDVELFDGTDTVVLGNTWHAVAAPSSGDLVVSVRATQLCISQTFGAEHYCPTAGNLRVSVRTSSGTTAWNNRLNAFSNSAELNRYTNVEVGSLDGATYDRIGSLSDFDSSEDFDATSFQFEENGNLVFQFRFGGVGHSSPTPLARDRPSTGITVDVSLDGNPRLKFVSADGSLLPGRSLPLEFLRPAGGFSNDAQMQADITLTMDTGTEEESGELTYSVNADDGAYDLFHDTVDEPVLTFTPFGVTPAGPPQLATFTADCPVALDPAEGTAVLRLNSAPSGNVDYTIGTGDGDVFIDVGGNSLSGSFNTDNFVNNGIIINNYVSGTVPITISFTSTSDPAFNSFTIETVLVFGTNADDCPAMETPDTPDPFEVSYTEPYIAPGDEDNVLEVAGRWVAVTVSIADDAEIAGDDTVTVTLSKSDSAHELVFDPPSGEAVLSEGTRTGEVRVRFDGGLQASDETYAIIIAAGSDASNLTPLSASESLDVRFTSNSDARFNIAFGGEDYYPTADRSRVTITLNVLRDTSTAIPISLNGLAFDELSSINIRVYPADGNGRVSLVDPTNPTFGNLAEYNITYEADSLMPRFNRTRFTITVNDQQGTDVVEATVHASINTRDRAFREYREDQGGRVEVKVNVVPDPGIAFEAPVGGQLTNDGATALMVSLTISALPEGLDVTVMLSSDPAAGVSFSENTVQFDSTNHGDYQQIAVTYMSATPPAQVRLIARSTSSDSILNHVDGTNEIEAELALGVMTPVMTERVSSDQIELAKPSAVAAGRWATATVTLASDPGVPVVVNFTSGDNVEFSPSARRVIFTGTATTVSLRYAADADMQVEELLTASLESSDPTFNGEQQEVDVSFNPSSEMIFFACCSTVGVSSVLHANVESSVTIAGVEYSPEPLTLTVNEGGGVEYQVHLEEAATSPVTIRAVVNPGGDERVFIVGGGEIVLQALEPSLPVNLTLTTVATGEPTGTATVDLAIITDDGAFNIFDGNKKQNIELVLEVEQSAISVGLAARAEPGTANWARMTVSLVNPPASDDVNVQITNVDTDNIAFNPADPMFTLNAGTPEMVLSVQYAVDPVPDDFAPTTVTLTTSLTSDDAGFVAMSFENQIVFETGNPALEILDPEPVFIARGRWIVLTATVTGARSANMTLSFTNTQGDSNVAIDPPLVALNPFQSSATVSVRYTRYSFTAGTRVISVQVQSSSSEPAFRLTDRAQVRFGNNSFSRVILLRAVNDVQLHTGNEIANDIAITIREGSNLGTYRHTGNLYRLTVARFGITVNGSGPGSAPNPAITVSIITEGDPRIGIVGGVEEMVGRHENRRHVFTITVAATGEPGGQGVVRLEHFTEDGAFDLVHRQRPFARFNVDIIGNPLVIASPDRAPGRTGIPVMVSWDSAPAADVDVSFTADDSDLAISPGMVNLDADGYEETVMVSYNADIPDGETREVVLIGRTSGSSDSNLNDWEKRTTIVFVPPVATISQPEPVLAGRWAEVVVGLVQDPTQPVVVNMTKDNPNIKFHSDDDTHSFTLPAGPASEMTVSVRYAAYTDSDVSGMVSAETTSADEDFNGLALNTNVRFTGIEAVQARIYDPGSPSDALDVTPSVTSMSEGGDLVFEVDLPIEPTAPVTVSLEVRPNPDGRTSFAGTGVNNTLEFTPLNYRTRQSLTVTASYSGAADGRTELWVHALSADDAFAYRTAVGNLFALQVDVRQLEMSMTQPDQSSAEAWTEVTLNLDETAVTATVMLSSTDSNVEFIPASGLATVTGETGKVVSVRYGSSLSSNTDAPVRAQGVGGHVGLAASQDVTFTPNPLGLDQPAAVVAGRWVTTTLDLGSNPSDPVTVRFSASDLVEFEGGPTRVIRDGSTATVTVRYAKNYSDPNAELTLQLIADLTSDDSSFNGLARSTDLRFSTNRDMIINVCCSYPDSNPGGQFHGNVDPTYYRASGVHGIISTPLTLTAFEGSDWDYDLYLEAAQNASVTIIARMRPGGDERVHLVGDDEVVLRQYDSLNFDPVATITMTSVATGDPAGLATVDLFIHTDDGAFTSYDPPKKESVQLVLAVEPRPISISLNASAAPGTGTWTEMTVSLVPPVSQPVMVQVGSGDANVAFNPSNNPVEFTLDSATQATILSVQYTQDTVPAEGVLVHITTSITSTDTRFNFENYGFLNQITFENATPAVGLSDPVSVPRGQWAQIEVSVTGTRAHPITLTFTSTDTANIEFDTTSVTLGRFMSEATVSYRHASYCEACADETEDISVTSSSSETGYGVLSDSKTATFTASESAFVRIGQDTRAIAGRWLEVTVSLDPQPGTFVTVAFDSGRPQVEFFPESSRVVLSGSSVATISVRYASNIDALVLAQVTAHVTSDDDRYDGAETSAELAFDSNPGTHFSICCDRDDFLPHANYTDSAEFPSTPLAVIMNEGGQERELGVQLHAVPVVPVTISMSIRPGGDQRLRIQSASNPLVLSDTTNVPVTLRALQTSEPTGFATVDFSIHTSDGAFTLFDAPRPDLESLAVEVTIVQHPVSVGLATQGTPGPSEWTRMTVFLRDPPAMRPGDSDSGNVEVTIGTGVANVDFNPDPTEVTLNAANPEFILSVRYNQPTTPAGGVLVPITTTLGGLSTTDVFHLLVNEIRFESNPPDPAIALTGPVPDSIRRGRWVQVTADITGTRTDDVTLHFSVPATGATVHPPAVTLNRFQSRAVVSVSHRVATGSGDVATRVDVETRSSETAFNLLTDTAAVTFKDLRESRSVLQAQGVATDLFDEQTIDVREGASATYLITVYVGSDDADDPTPGMTVSLYTEGDPRVGIHAGVEQLAFISPLSTASDQAQLFTITVAASGAPAGSGVVRPVLFTDDGAYNLYAQENPYPRINVNVIANPLKVDAPDRANINSEVAVAVSLVEAPPANVDVEFTTADTTLMFTPDNMVSFTSSDHQGAIMVRYNADDFTDGETRAVTITGTATSTDGDYDDWVTTATLVFAKAGVVVQDLPANVAAGRWVSSEVRIFSAPAGGANVQVSFSTSETAITYLPDSGQVVLDADTRTATVSLFYDGYLDAAKDVSFNVSSDSTDSDFTDTTDLMINFEPIADAYWSATYQAGPDAAQAQEGRPGATGNLITITVVKNSDNDVEVSIHDGAIVPVEAGITIGLEVLPGGDDRVGIKDDVTELGFTTTGSTPAAQDAVVQIADRDTGGANQGSATVRFTMSSQDGAYREYGEENGNTVDAEVVIVDQPVLMISDPVAVIAQDTARPVTVSLEVEPAVAFTVTLTTAAPDSNVVITPPELEITPSNYNTGVVFNVAYIGAYVSGTNIDLVANSTSDHTLFNSLRATRQVRVVEEALAISEPAEVVAGRWTEFSVEALVTPLTQPVMVNLTKDQANMKFLDPDTNGEVDDLEVTLSGSDTSVMVSVRYAAHAPNDVSGVITADAESSGTIYDTVTSTANASFTSNLNARARVFDPGSTSDELMDDPSEISVVEGAVVSFPVDLGLAPEESVMVTFDQQSGGDSRASFVGNDNEVEFTSSDYSTRQMVAITVAYSGAADGSTTYEVGFSSEDGAFALNEKASTNPLDIQLDVRQLVLSMTEPNEATAGAWTSTMLSLDEDDATATVALSSTNGNVVFMPEQVILSGTTAEEVRIRYNGALTAPVTVPVEARGTEVYSGMSAMQNAVFQPNPLSMGEIDSAVAGRWTAVQVEIASSQTPTADVNIQLSADPSANVEFDPSDQVVLNAGTRSREVMVRYDAYSASGLDVDIEAVASSTDPNFDTLEVSRTFEVESSGTARWSVSDGDDRIYPESTTDIITVTVVKGRGTDVEVSLDEVAPLAPTANVMIDVVVASDDGNLIASVSPDPVEFEPSGARAFDVRIVAADIAGDAGVGKATLDFDMTTDDRAYQLYANEPGHGSKLRVEVDVIDTPILLGGLDPVVAGRWTEIEVSAVAGDPTADVEVRLTNDPDNDNVKFRTAANAEVDDILVTLSASETSVMVPVRYVAHSESGATEEITASATSGHSLYNNISTTADAMFTSNAEARVRAYDAQRPTEEVATDPVVYSLPEGAVLRLPVDLGLEPVEDVRVTFVPKSGSDSNTRIVGDGYLDFNSSNHDDSQTMVVTLGYTTADDVGRVATYEMRVSSEDGAYAVHEDVANPVELQINIRGLTLTVNAPGAAATGEWAIAEIGLNQSDAQATVRMRAASGVIFDPEPTENIILDGSNARMVSVQYTGTLGTGETRSVPIHVDGQGSHAGMVAMFNANFVSNRLGIGDIPSAVAGHWSEFNVNLTQLPPAGVDVNVQMSANPSAGVEFDPATFDLNAGTPSETVRVRYNRYTTTPDDVDITASTTSTNTEFNGVSANEVFRYESNAGARWSVSDGTDSGTRYPDSASDIITVTVFQGNDAQVEISLDSVSPAANVTITPSEASDPDNLVTAPSVIEFTPGGVDSFNVNIGVAATGTGKATLDFDMTTDDRAYQLYAAEAGHGSKLRVEVEVLDQPLAMGTPNLDPVVAGRWTVSNLRLSSTMGLGSDSVTVVLSSGHDVQFIPDNNIELRNMTPTEVSIRHTIDVNDVGFRSNIEVTATSDSGNDFYDNTVELTIGISPNTAMTIVSTAPAAEFDEGEDVTIPVNLGADVEGQVVVSVYVNDGGRNRVTPSERSFTFGSGTPVERDLVLDIVTTDTRQSIFGVSVTLSVIESSSETTDGAYAIKHYMTVYTFMVKDTTPGMVEPSAPSTIDEGATGNMTISLSVQPTTNVQIDLSSNNASLQISPAQLTFTPEEWEMGTRAKSVELMATHDEVDNTHVTNEANISFVMTTDDENYDMTPGDVQIEINDIDTAGLLITPSTARIEAREMIEYSVRLGSKPTQAVNVAVAVTDSEGMPLDLPTGVDIDLTGAQMMTFSTTNWDVPQMVVLTVSTDNEEIEIEEDIPFVLSFDASSTGEPNYDRDDIDVEITGEIRRSNVGASEHVGKSVAAVDLGAAQFALDVVGGQIGGSIGGGTGGGAPQTGNLNLSRPGSTDEDDGWTDLETGWRSDFNSLIDRGAGFSLPFGRDGNTVLWSRIAYYDVSGTSQFEDDIAKYDGDAFGLLYGVSRYHDDGSSYGLALSHTSSDIDLEEAGDLREVRSEIVSVHPFYGIEFAGGTRTWVVGSLGSGDVKVLLDDDSTVETGSGSRSIAVGLERGWDLDGLSLSARVEGITGRTKLDHSDEFENEGIVEEDGSPIESDLLRLRLEFELSKGYRTEAGGFVRPYLSAGGRFDGGDLNDIYAVEVGGGVRASFAGSYGIDLKAKFQLNDADHREHSVSGRIDYDAGRDRRGLVASVSQDIDDDDRSHKGSVGYGWGMRLLGQRGVFGPTLHYDSGGGPSQELGFDSRRLRLGFTNEQSEYEVTARIVAFEGR